MNLEGDKMSPAAEGEPQLPKQESEALSVSLGTSHLLLLNEGWTGMGKETLFLKNGFALCFQTKYSCCKDSLKM